MLNIIALCLVCISSPSRPIPPILDTAIERMGGLARLQSVKQARLDYVTQWYRTSFETDLFGGSSISIETDVDLRDYDRPARRYTRTVTRANIPVQIVDLVVDSVAAVRNPGATGWAAQNVAYVDERREEFAFAPERILVAARSDARVSTLRDTIVNGAPYARVAASTAGIPFVLWIDRTTGYLARVEYHVAQPNDFGLAGWGPMDVSIRFSRWSKVSGGFVYPMSIDVARVGRPYKRLSLSNVELGATLVSDSFSISDSTRMLFARTQNHPMHDVPLSGAGEIEQGLIQFAAAGAPTGAIRVGGSWWFLEAGIAPFNAERAADWLARNKPGSTIAGVLVTWPSPYGGLLWFANHGVSALYSAGTKPVVDAVARNWNIARLEGRIVRTPLVIGTGEDRIELVPVALPDLPNALLVYSKKHHLLYGALGSPLQIDAALRVAARHGWVVDWIGNPGRLKTPAPVNKG